MRRLFYLILAVICLSVVQNAEAQMNRRKIKKNNKRIMTYRGRKSSFEKDKAYSMVGISINALNYYGDLAPKPSRFSTDISFTKPAIGLTFAHRFGPRYTLLASFMYGTLKGSDAESADQGDTENGVFRYRRNLSFRNRIKELSVVANIDLFDNMATYVSRVKWTPYIFGGVALFHHNPQAQAPATDLDGNPLPEAGKWVNLRPLGTEGQYSELQDGDVNKGIKPYKLIQIAIPIGLGARFKLNEVLDLAAEIGFRYTFTDYLDDVSKNYVDLGVLKSPLAKAMSYRSGEIADPAQLQTETTRDGSTYNLLPGYGKEHPDNLRGNKNDKDIYMVTTIRVTCVIGKTFHRAKFR